MADSSDDGFSEQRSGGRGKRQQKQKQGQKPGRSSAMPRPEANAADSGNVCVIMRGLPGSGKSTLTRALVADFTRADQQKQQKQEEGDGGDSGGEVVVSIHSADDFFVSPKTGKYHFDPSKLGQAHAACIRGAFEAMCMRPFATQQGKEGGSSTRTRHVCIIDNTNVEAWEPQVYVKMALEVGFRVEIRETDTDWRFDARELAQRNTHGVPRDTIERMLGRWHRNLTVEAILSAQVPGHGRAGQKLLGELLRNRMLTLPHTRQTAQGRAKNAQTEPAVAAAATKTPPTGLPGSPTRGDDDTGGKEAGSVLVLGQGAGEEPEAQVDDNEEKGDWKKEFAFAQDETLMKKSHAAFNRASKVKEGPKVTFHLDFADMDADGFEEHMAGIICALSCRPDVSGVVYVLEQQHEYYRVDYPRGFSASDDELNDLLEVACLFVDGEMRDMCDEEGTWSISAKGYSGNEPDSLSLEYCGRDLDEALRANPPGAFFKWECVEQVGCGDGSKEWKPTPPKVKSANFRR